MCTSFLLRILLLALAPIILIPATQSASAQQNEIAALNQQAIRLFQRNVQEYPESGNVWDSLGEAYAAAGKKDLAIKNYEKSLQLDPKN